MEIETYLKVVFVRIVLRDATCVRRLQQSEYSKTNIDGEIEGFQHNVNLSNVVFDSY